MLAYVFPGQGSQARGMGRELFDKVPLFSALEDDVDAILGYSLRELCLEDPQQRLKETRFTQPSLYVVNALHYYGASAEGRRPQFLAGHSLGEYNALLAAGAFDFLTGLKLVKKRGEVMARAAPGGMAAIIGMNARECESVIRRVGLVSLDVANINSPTQTVISGPLEDIGAAGPTFEAVGARLYVPLNVGAAFHSRYMQPAAKEFEEFLDPFVFHSPKMPVVANVTGNFYASDNASTQIKQMLVRQITHPVMWTQTVQLLIGRGVTEFKEIGPGTVLQRLVQEIEKAGTEKAALRA